jgi:hypothetical protein
MMRKPYKYLLWFALLNLVVGLAMTGAQAHSSLARQPADRTLYFCLRTTRTPGR